jgi:hypothetical protein
MFATLTNGTMANLDGAGGVWVTLGLLGNVHQ